MCHSCPEEVLNLLPMLSLYVQLILDRVSVHDICQNRQLLIIVKVLQRISQYLPISVDHNNVDMLVPFIWLVFGSISKHDGHTPSFVFQVFEADEAKVESNVGAYLPDLKVVTWS